MSNLPPLSGLEIPIGGIFLAIGTGLTLLSRGASLAGNSLSAFADTNPASALARISLIFAAALKLPGFYTLGLSLVSTTMGMMFLTSGIIKAAGYSDSKLANLAALALIVLTPVCVIYVGMPTALTTLHNVGVL